VVFSFASPNVNEKIEFAVAPNGAIFSHRDLEGVLDHLSQVYKLPTSKETLVKSGWIFFEFEEIFDPDIITLAQSESLNALARSLEYGRLLDFCTQRGLYPIGYLNFSDTHLTRRGIDYDLEACLKYNQTSFSAQQIKRVLAVYEGERDRTPWHWIIQTIGDRMIYLSAGCDYTGWDCISWINVEITNYMPSDWIDYVYEGSFEGHKQVVVFSLGNQLFGKKESTWRERMDKEFGLK
jgi:hypothetical protein